MLSPNTALRVFPDLNCDGTVERALAQITVQDSAGLTGDVDESDAGSPL